MRTDLQRQVSLCRQLIRAADDHRYRHPQQALRRALAARDLATTFDQQQLGLRPWRRLQTDAWCVVASAYRAVGDLLRAENSLNVALDMLDGDQLTADWSQRAAYLRCDQRRYDEALDLNSEALAAFERLGDAPGAAGTLVDRALIVRRSGHAAAAIPLLVEALEHLDRKAAPRTWLAAVHNLALYLQETAATSDQHTEALRWLHLAIEAHGDLPEPINVLKLRQLAALTAIALGRVVDGERELEAVRQGFAELGSADEVVPLLHLARLAAARADASAVRGYAGRLFPLLGKLDLDSEAYSVLVSLLDAAQSPTVTTVTVELVQQAIDRLSTALEA